MILVGSTRLAAAVVLAGYTEVSSRLRFGMARNEETSGMGGVGACFLYHCVALGVLCGQVGPRRVVLGSW